MDARNDALHAAEVMANLLQAAHGDSSARWWWQRHTDSLELTPRAAIMHDASPLHRDYLACGEVLQTVRTTLVDEGWYVRTTITGRTTAAMPGVTLRLRDGVTADDAEDDALAIAYPRSAELEQIDVGHLGTRTTTILLRDAAVEYGAEVETLTVGELVGAGVRVSVHEAPGLWRVMSPYRGSEDTPTLVLSTTEGDFESRILAGVAWADIQATAKAVGREAIRIGVSDEEAVLGYLRSEARVPQVVFRLGISEGRRPHRSQRVGESGHSRYGTVLPLPRRASPMR